MTSSKSVPTGRPWAFAFAVGAFVFVTDFLIPIAARELRSIDEQLLYATFLGSLL